MTDLLDLWGNILPQLRGVVENALINAKVNITHRPVFDEWVGGEPTLAVHWSRPSHRAPQATGGSVSFQLKQIEEGRLEFQMWGVVWQDEFSNDQPIKRWVNTVATGTHQTTDTALKDPSFPSDIKLTVEKLISDVEKTRQSRFTRTLQSEFDLTKARAAVP